MSRSVSITQTIPHRGPMLLVDEIVAISSDTVHARKTFRADEFFVQGHFPGHPVVPGVILCECAVQAGAVLVANVMGQDPAGSDRVPVLGRMNKVKFRRPVYPDDVIDINVVLVEIVSGVYCLSAQVQCHQKTVLTFDFACTLTTEV